MENKAKDKTNVQKKTALVILTVWDQVTFNLGSRGSIKTELAGLQCNWGHYRINQLRQMNNDDAS